MPHERTIASHRAHTTAYAARSNANGSAMIDAVSERDRLQIQTNYTPQ
jgi:hypothetical protein